jgi:hypothetical protein
LGERRELLGRECLLFEQEFDPGLKILAPFLHNRERTSLRGLDQVLNGDVDFARGCLSGTCYAVLFQPEEGLGRNSVVGASRMTPTLGSNPSSSAKSWLSVCSFSS